MTDPVTWGNLVSRSSRQWHYFII